jgi:predicted HAD superfamily Cof-like phosphohydrolase
VSVQRWGMAVITEPDHPTLVGMREFDNGDFVTYADHVAALAEARTEGAIAGVTEMAAIRPARTLAEFREANKYANGRENEGTEKRDSPDVAAARDESPVARDVRAFHRAFGLPVAQVPTLVDAELAGLRKELLREEVQEFTDASDDRDLVEIADALADIVYVAYGSALTYGIDLDAVLAEVHRSNMSKLDADGKPVLRDDGKVLKSDRYSPPDVAATLRKPVDGAS